MLRHKHFKCYVVLKWGESATGPVCFIFHFSNCFAEKTHWGRMLGEPPTFSPPWIDIHKNLVPHLKMIFLQKFMPHFWAFLMEFHKRSQLSWRNQIVESFFLLILTLGVFLCQLQPNFVVFLNSYPPAAMMDSPKLFGKRTLLLYSRASFCAIFLWSEPGRFPIDSAGGVAFCQPCQALCMQKLPMVSVS